MKRGCNLGQQSRSRSHNTYLQQPTPSTAVSSNGLSSPPSATSMPYKGARKSKGKGATKGKRQDYSSTPAPLYGKGFLEAKVLSYIKARDLQKVRFLRVRVRDPILASRYQRWCVFSVIYMATMNRIVARSMRCKIQILTNKLGVNLTLGNSY